jgi:serine/threonine protein kinase
LDRSVAVKVLPSAFSLDSDRLHRFEHEARCLGALNHPNLLAIYDIGSQDGVHYLVIDAQWHAGLAECDIDSGFRAGCDSRKF